MKELTQQEAETFLARIRSEWHCLPDEAFDGVPDELKAKLQEADKDQLRICYEDLMRVIAGFQQKHAFAKQYELWVNDCMEMFLGSMRNPSALGTTERIQEVTRTVMIRAVNLKLRAMEGWYHTVFTDTPLTEYPDKEMMAAAAQVKTPISTGTGKSGCAVMVLAGIIGSFALSVCVSFLLTMTR
jgi:hypothetical protein